MGRCTTVPGKTLYLPRRFRFWHSFSMEMIGGARRSDSFRIIFNCAREHSHIPAGQAPNSDTMKEHESTISVPDSELILSPKYLPLSSSFRFRYDCVF